MIKRSGFSVVSGEGSLADGEFKVAADCPFCGSGNVQVDHMNGITYFLCDGCGAVVSFRGHEGEEDSMRMWNGRK